MNESDIRDKLKYWTEKFMRRYTHACMYADVYGYDSRQAMEELDRSHKAHRFVIKYSQMLKDLKAEEEAWITI